jgi:hypothetical protein
MTDETTYNLVLQDYEQWRISQDLNPWVLAVPPGTQEVVRYGLMQNYLNSLPPPPPGSVCPIPRPSRTHRKPRCRRRARALGATGPPAGETGLHGQVGPSDEADPHGETESPGQTGLIGETMLPTTTDSANGSSPQDKQKKRSKRGKRSKKGQKDKVPESSQTDSN